MELSQSEFYIIWLSCLITAAVSFACCMMICLIYLTIPEVRSYSYKLVVYLCATNLLLSASYFVPIDILHGDLCPYIGGVFNYLSICAAA